MFQFSILNIIQQVNPLSDVLFKIEKIEDLEYEANSIFFLNNKHQFDIETEGSEKQNKDQMLKKIFHKKFKIPFIVSLEFPLLLLLCLGCKYFVL